MEGWFSFSQRSTLFEPSGTPPEYFFFVFVNAERSSKRISAGRFGWSISILQSQPRLDSTLDLTQTLTLWGVRDRQGQSCSAACESSQGVGTTINACVYLACSFFLYARITPFILCCRDMSTKAPQSCR